MVQAEFLLLTRGLNINHARLIMGTSMGGMHTWLWGEQHPQFMDALMPLACLPTQVSGRNRVWRRLIIEAIRGEPAWQGGEYHAQPPSLRSDRNDLAGGQQPGAAAAGGADAREGR